MKIAIPHLIHIGENGRELYVDMFIEKFGTGELPERYEAALVKHFRTSDKKQMLRRALSAKTVVIMCPESKRIEIVDAESGELVRRLGRVSSETRIADRLTESLFAEEQKKHARIVGVAPDARVATIATRLAREGRMALSVARSIVSEKS